MRVFEVMNKTVHKTSPVLPAEDAWQLMFAKGVRHLVVTDGSKVVGVLSDSDLGGRSGAAVRAGALAGDLMERNVIAIGPNDTIRQAANLMRGHLTGCLPVVENDRLVGVVTIADVLRIVGKGVDRPGRETRASTHYRVPHRKAAAATGRW